MAIILSVKTVSEIQEARLTMDTQVDRNITLTLEDGQCFILSPYRNGLCYFDTNTILTNPKSKSGLEY